MSVDAEPPEPDPADTLTDGAVFDQTPPNPDPVRMPRRRWARRIALASVLIAGGLAMTYGWPSDAANPDPIPSGAGPKVVVVAAVEPADVTRSRVFAGVLRAHRHAALSFTIPGRIAEREVDVGTHVEAGQTLARLDGRAYRNQLATARSQRSELAARKAQADRDHRRMTQLVETNSAPPVQAERTASSLDVLEANRSAAASGVAEARRLLDEAVLEAPFAGTVTAVGLEAGEYANPGVPVLELSGDGPLELEVEVPEMVVASLAPGQALDVVFPLLDGRRITGKVLALAGGARGPGHLFPVRVAVPRSEGLLAGMTAELHVETPVRAPLSVPVDAVINPGGERPSVFVVREGVVQRADVEVVDVVDGRAFVEGKLAEGDAVVVGGHAGLASGVAVEVRS